jgi:XTP/dITP diphosphohydrolase
MHKLSPGKLVVASHNAGKIREITALLGPYGIEPISAAALDLPEPEETGTTFAANALLKAVSSCDLSGLAALADDSGICVEALGGEPGVYTADWAETEGHGQAGRDWMLAMSRVEDRLNALGKEVSRKAYFACTLAIAWPDGSDAIFEGRVEGTLIWPPRGDRGFGYDPMFVPDGFTKTFGEMEPDAKHRISHRADAFAKLVSAVLT